MLDHRAGRVPVQDVLDLVGEDPRELVGRARPLEQAAEDHDVAARRGERIDVRGIDHARAKRVGRGRRRRRQAGHDRVERALPARIRARAVGRGELVGHGAPQALLPGHGHPRGGERGDERNAPEIERRRDADDRNARQDGEAHPPASSRGIVEAGRPGRRLVEAVQKCRIRHDDGLRQLPAPLEPDLLAFVESLRLADVPVGPEPHPPRGRGHLEPLAHQPDGRGIAERGLPVQVVRGPHEPGHRMPRLEPSETGRAMRRVQLRGGARWPARRTRTLSVEGARRWALIALAEVEAGVEEARPGPRPWRTPAGPAAGCARGRAVRPARGSGRRSRYSSPAPTARRGQACRRAGWH